MKNRTLATFSLFIGLVAVLYFLALFLDDLNVNIPSTDELKAQIPAVEAPNVFDAGGTACEDRGGYCYWSCTRFGTAPADGAFGCEASEYCCLPS
ncbi:MAG: hypothetical protein V1834_01710 [Candidatus Micrarchaeota archaeon]